MMKVQVRGSEFRIYDDLVANFKVTGPAGVRAATADLLSVVKVKLSRSGSAPAAPGQPPVEHSGDLLNSFHALPVTVFASSVVSGIYSNHPGAGRLEWGATDERGTMTFPHPYLATSMREVASRVDMHFTRVGVL